MLVNCVAYEDGVKVGDITVDAISDFLKKPTHFVWVALLDPSEDELQTMRHEFNLHELAVEDARRGHERPKLEEYGESLFVVLHTFESNDAGELKVGEVAIFVGAQYVLSVRQRCSAGFAGVRERSEREPHLLRFGSAFVLYAIMDTVVDRYFPVVEKFELQLDAIEENIFSKKSSFRGNLEDLYTLKRKLILLQHSTVSLTEAVSKLHGGRVPKVCEHLQDYFRDVSDHLIRLNKSIESLREMTTTGVQVNLSMISLAESEVTKQLASYGALFAAPTAIAGIYGMNFKFMPELEFQWGYPLVICVMIIVDCYLWFRFKRAGWL